MNKIFSYIVFFLFFYLTCYSQDCKTEFIAGITSTYNKKVEKFNKVSFTAVDKFLKHERLNTIEILVIFSCKEIYREDIVPEKLLCYLNYRKIEYDEAIIFKDTLYHGIVTASPSSKYDVMYLDTNQILSVFMQPLAQKIKEIKPDFIFRVYNIPEAYWYIKDEQLFVLTYEHQDKKMNDIKTFNVDTYLGSVFEKSDVLFLTTKRKR